MTSEQAESSPAPSWTALFNAFDQCPWPGPRPLGVNDNALLVGRDPDRSTFLHEVDTHRLIILAGASGVGKTSLLEAGLIPDLRDRGRYETAVVREWGADTSAGDDAAAFLAGKLQSALGPLGHDMPGGSDFFWALNDQFGEDLVIILDQFEELMRFDRVLKDSVIDLLVGINKNMGTKIIVSLRNEYLHDLRKLEREATPFSLSRFILEDVDPGFALDVVRAPEASAPAGGHVIRDDAALDIANRWQSAREAAIVDGSDPFGRIGLLHLQALLYVLHARADGDVVTTQVVESFADEVRAGAPEDLLRSGVELAIDVKLARCQAAFAACGVDDYRIEGVQSLLVRTVPKLSSGGYKIVISAQELAREVLGAERSQLVRALASARQAAGNPPDGPASPAQVTALEDRLVTMSLDDRQGLLSMDRRELAALADLDCPGECSWTDRLHEGADPAVADPEELSCGPVSGLAPGAVLIEELRRYALMLAWLETTKLVRVTRPGGSKLMVSLIHDGFGEALRRWCERRSALFPAHEALHALTVPLGAYFNWGSAEILDGLDGLRVLANMRWRGDTITANFRRVVFVNCDFRGALFQSCTFEGVTLVNCRLDGTLVSDSTVIGGFDDATGDWSEDEPEFTVSAEGNTLIDALAFYQRLDSDLPPEFLAQRVGKPAIAATPEVKGRALWHLEPETGGFCVVGGRLSSFTMRHSTFAAGGRVSFRHVAGSGMDIVEQHSGSVEIFGCGLRHVTISASESTDDDEILELVIRGSLVIQMWIGQGVPLRGRAIDSRLVQLFNAAGPGRMVIDATSVDDLCVGLSLADGSAAGATPYDEVITRSRRVDYARGSATDLRSAGGEVTGAGPASRP